MITGGALQSLTAEGRQHILSPPWAFFLYFFSFLTASDDCVEILLLNSLLLSIVFIAFDAAGRLIYSRAYFVRRQSCSA